MNEQMTWNCFDVCVQLSHHQSILSSGHSVSLLDIHLKDTEPSARLYRPVYTDAW